MSRAAISQADVRDALRTRAEGPASWHHATRPPRTPLTRAPAIPALDLDATLTEAAAPLDRLLDDYRQWRAQQPVTLGVDVEAATRALAPSLGALACAHAAVEHDRLRVRIMREIGPSEIAESTGNAISDCVVIARTALQGYPRDVTTGTELVHACANAAWRRAVPHFTRALAENGRVVLPRVLGELYELVRDRTVERSGRPWAWGRDKAFAGLVHTGVWELALTRAMRERELSVPVTSTLADALIETLRTR